MCTLEECTLECTQCLVYIRVYKVYIRGFRVYKVHKVHARVYKAYARVHRCALECAESTKCAKYNLDVKTAKVDRC